MATAVLEALLDSVSQDLNGRFIQDVTAEGLARAWLIRERIEDPLPDGPLDLLICNAEQVSDHAERLAEHSLILALTTRTAAPPEDQTWVCVATVRSPEGQWCLLTRRAEADSEVGFSMSVVVSCQDQARDLFRLLTVLAAQDAEHPWELVVVDRGSFDETSALLRSLEGDTQIISRRRHTSYLAGIDAGIRSARSNIVMVIGPALVPTPEWLDLVVDATHPDRPLIPLVGTVLDGPSGDTLHSERTSLLPKHEGLELFVVPRADYIAAGGFSPKLPYARAGRSLSQSLGDHAALPHLSARLPGIATTTRPFL